MTRQSRRSELETIRIVGARENNLKNLTLELPKRRITVFTGVSGSGKSSLVFDTIAAEAQRQLNETFSSFVRQRLPHYGQPAADRLENLSPAVLIDQRRLGANARSTVGTVTDIYALLRLLYSRLGKPFVGEATAFSFNDPQGMCLRCRGRGEVLTIDIDELLDPDKSLNEGAIRFPAFAPGSWNWKYFVRSGFFDNDKKVRDFSEAERELLLYRQDSTQQGKAWNPLVADEKGAEGAAFEALLPKFERIFLNKDPERMKGARRVAFERIVKRKPCPLCQGARLNAQVLASRIAGKNIAECAAMQVRDLSTFIRSLEGSETTPVRDALVERLEQLLEVGLGYLSLDRETATLSGGESQRVKLVRHLGSSLSDMMYIFDEPSVGLHPHDVARLNRLLRTLCDRGNTVLVVEHDPDVIAIADHIVDMGPGAGEAGGTAVYTGSIEGLRRSDTLTGRSLGEGLQLKKAYLKPKGELVIENATRHNLKGVSTVIARGVLTVLTGPAGSGKSSLLEELAARYPEAVAVNQRELRGSRRSNPATFTGMLEPIRHLFAQANGVSASLFSPNSKGACPTCRGLGVIYLDLAFLDPVVSPCETCGGRRFKAEVLQYRLHGNTIADVLAMRVTEARRVFPEAVIAQVLERLGEVGLGYLTLGQSLSTLSGGERQRLKLATQLEQAGQIYLFDEPTSGLHVADIANLLGVFERITARQGTVIVIEHSLEVIAQADWVLELGPGAGSEGGELVFSGRPADIIDAEHSLTGKYLKARLSSKPMHP